MRFIYVFDNNARRRLELAGYTLLKADERNSVFVFDNDSTLKFDLEANSFVLSDTLTF